MPLKQAHFALVHCGVGGRAVVSFASHRKTIERDGLLEVWQFRLSRCDADESELRYGLQSARQIVAEVLGTAYVAYYQGRY